VATRFYSSEEVADQAGRYHDSSGFSAFLLNPPRFSLLNLTGLESLSLARRLTTLQIWRKTMFRNRSSRFFKFLRQVDNFWFHLDGFAVDAELLDWIYGERELFKKDGWIKEELSLIPGRDLSLKRIAKEYGGWQTISSKTFSPPEELYRKLDYIGFSRTAFDHTRRFLADPAGYRKSAMQEK
jgi:hypothetical protein